MAGIILPHRWRQQPIGPVELMLPEGLKPIYWRLTTPNALLGESGVEPVATTQNRFGLSTASWPSYLASVAGLTRLTRLWVGWISSLPAMAYYCVGGGTYGVNDTGLFITSSGAVRMGTRFYDGTRPVVSNETVSTNSLLCIAVARGLATTQHRFYVNGSPFTYGTNSDDGTGLQHTATERVNGTDGSAPNTLFGLIVSGHVSTSFLEEVTKNPWQLFRPIRRPVFVSLFVGTTPDLHEESTSDAVGAALSASAQLIAQAVINKAAGAAQVASALYGRFGHPDADVSNTGWLPSSGADLYPMVDEGVRNDSDYVYTQAPAVARISLTQHADPGSTVHAIKIASPPGYTPKGALTVRLYCGLQLISTWVITDLAADEERQLTLSEAERDAITDYTNLELELEAG